MDYTTFPRPLKKHRDKFIYGLMDDLVETGLPAPYSRAVAGSICELMSNDTLFYHNYIHPLAMFSFAEQNGIELELWERLAVWFHDAIYIKGNKNNERRSADLVDALFKDHDLKILPLSSVAAFLKKKLRILVRKTLCKSATKSG